MPSDIESFESNDGKPGSHIPAESGREELSRPCFHVSRRSLLKGAAVATTVGVGGKLVWDYQEGFQTANTAILAAPRYDEGIADLIRRGLGELGFGRDHVRGKSVLLKPNLVEPSADAPHINTHPEFVRAVIEVMRHFDAREVFVAEGPGHCRDTDLVLEQSGFRDMLKHSKTQFIDLNHDDVFSVKNRLAFTSISEFQLPLALKRADLVVSLPKMKTHHWAGVTLSMKNLFGVMPGICYGWPKNVLHQAGIPQSILDITAAVRPHLAIVDGIIGMDGDGPIMGSPKAAGVIVMGTSLPAVDATATRLMGLEPMRIPYLLAASGRLGPIKASHIEQRGESLDSLRQPFSVLEYMSELRT